MKYLFAADAATPLRAEASDASEMISQLIFGDIAELLESKPPWLKVRHTFDGYEGWVSDKMMRPWTAGVPAESGRIFFKERGSFLIEKMTGHRIYLPLGASLLEGIGNDFDLGGEAAWRLPSAVQLEQQRPLKDAPEIALAFLNTSYLWGGCSSYGIDCSGLVQRVYRACGISLKRDASQQQLQGEQIPYAKRQVGDLMFCRKPNQKGVTHVGMVLDNDEIIHASGKVRIDKLVPEGIIHTEKQELSHVFISMNRYKK